ncbi:hypothetical protein IP87_15675 [beta proteobacterium AAP121]|nr:hypothetical protein IP80_14975 [beta proteobacterium AAP65]KPF95816.1 hypothetical protein IP87_15675 [beta proteobacterium AAP121]
MLIVIVDAARSNWTFGPMVDDAQLAGASRLDGVGLVDQTQCFVGRFRMALRSRYLGAHLVDVMAPQWQWGPMSARLLEVKLLLRSQRRHFLRSLRLQRLKFIGLLLPPKEVFNLRQDSRHAHRTPRVPL